MTIEQRVGGRIGGQRRAGGLMLASFACVVLVLAGCACTQHVDKSHAVRVIKGLSFAEGEKQHFLRVMDPVRMGTERNEFLAELEKRLDLEVLRGLLAKNLEEHLDATTVRALDRFLRSDAGREFTERLPALRQSTRDTAWQWGNQVVSKLLAEQMSEK